MSNIIDDRLYLPKPYRLPPTPGIPSEAFPLINSTPLTPTEQGSTSTQRIRLHESHAINHRREAFVTTDVGCFLTGYTCLSLEMAHLVNAVRTKDDPNREPKVIDFLVRRLGIAHRQRDTFRLESQENIVLLHTPYHRHLDEYATYVITLSKESLQAAIAALEEANQQWEERVAQRSDSSRMIDWRNMALTHNLRFDVVLLHPYLFLPRGQPLITVDSLDPPSYAMWTVINKELRRVGSPPDSDPYPPFSYTSRDELNAVNPFFLILNAGLKLLHQKSRFGFGVLTLRQLDLVHLTLHAYELLYYLPQNCSLPSYDELHRSVHRHTPSTATVKESVVTYTADAGSVGEQMEGVRHGPMESDNIDVEEDWDISAKEENQILSKLHNPATSLNDMMEMGALFLEGRKYYKPFPVVPGIELPEEPRLFAGGA